MCKWYLFLQKWPQITHSFIIINIIINNATTTTIIGFWNVLLNPTVMRGVGQRLLWFVFKTDYCVTRQICCFYFSQYLIVFFLSVSNSFIWYYGIIFDQLDILYVYRKYYRFEYVLIFTSFRWSREKSISRANESLIIYVVLFIDRLTEYFWFWAKDFF